MRARYLLDEHISPKVARSLKRQGTAARAVAASELSGLSDADLLRLAARESRVFVTYDTATVPAAFWELFRAGEPLPGLVLVSAATIPSSDLAGLARALHRLAALIELGQADPSGGIFLEAT